MSVMVKGHDKLDLVRGDELHACTQVIIDAGENMMKAFYNAGVALKTVRDKELYKEAHESFDSYYTELGFERSRVYRAIQAVEKLSLEEVASVRLGGLYAILPALTSDNKGEMVKMAQSLSISDLRHQLKVKRVAQVEPKLPEPPKTYPCVECGGQRGIRFADLCRCRMTNEQVKYISTIIDKVEADEYEI